jgi:hypothetical protein
MSTILEALRRLEKDKRPEAAAPLESRIVEPEPPSRVTGGSMLPWAIAVFALVTAGGMFFLSGRQPPVESLAARPAPEPPSSRPPVVAPSPRSTLQSVPFGAAMPTSADPPGGAPRFEKQSPTARVMQESATPPRRDRVASRPPPSQSPPRAQADRPTGIPSPRAPEALAPIALKATEVPPSAVAKAPPSTPSPVRPSPPLDTKSEAPRQTAAAEVPSRAPDLVVLKTIWHPSAERRLARLELEAGGEVREVREGEWVQGFEIREIRLSGVILEKEGVTSERRVGRRP